MPVHDWTRVAAGIFHHFHHGWTAAIVNALNAGQLPAGYFALAEQIIGDPIPNVLTLHVSPAQTSTGGGAAIMPAPQTRIVCRSTAQRYARKADRIVVRHESGRVVAVIELVSPGNKDSRHALRAFVERATAWLYEGVHLVVVDVFPPTPRDPQGIHRAIWDEIEDNDFELPADKHLTLAAYSAGVDITAYVENFAPGDDLFDMPLFVTAEHCVPLPLEATYQATWNAFPALLKPQLENC